MTRFTFLTLNDSQQARFDGFNYSTYGNGTISNWSRCFLVRSGYLTPIIFPNGTVVNGTACDTPDNAITPAGIATLVIGVLAAVIIPVTAYNLKKHGRSLLFRKRTMPHPYRWEYYWCMINSAVLCIAGCFFMDVTRCVAQGTSMSIYGILFEASCACMLATVWELTRNWNRQSRERFKDEFADFSPAEERARPTYRLEFILPCTFYLFAFICLFVEALRPWTRIVKLYAPDAMDSRFRAGAFIGIVALAHIPAMFIMTVLSWRPRLKSAEVAAILLCLAFCIIRVAYQIAQFWDYSINSLNPDARIAVTVPVGWLPVLMVLIIVNVKGLLVPNEDEFLVNRRKQREKEFRANMRRGDFSGLVDTDPFAGGDYDVKEAFTSVHSRSNSGYSGGPGVNPADSSGVRYEISPLGIIKPVGGPERPQLR